MRASLLPSAHSRSRVYAVAIAGLLILCGLRIALVLSAVVGVLPLGGDANAYLAAARAILHGQPPVGLNGAPFLPEAPAEVPAYLYPPLLAILLIPLAAMPYPLGLYLWVALVAATTVLLAYVLRPLVGWPVAAVGVLFFLPSWESLWLGQINALVAVLTVVMLRSLDRGAAGRLGVALSLGTLLKITPALAAGALVIQRRWRSLWFAGLTALGIVLLALPLVSLDSWYSGMRYALSNPFTSPLLLSWAAILRRQPGPLGELGPALVGALLLGLTLWRSRSVSLRCGLAAASLLPLLISDTIWHYSAILALPALAVLWQHNTPRARLLALASWVLISLAGGLWQPTALSLCWCALCWPGLLEPAGARAGRATIEL